MLSSRNLILPFSFLRLYEMPNNKEVPIFDSIRDPGLLCKNIFVIVRVLSHPLYFILISPSSRSPHILIQRIFFLETLIENIVPCVWIYAWCWNSDTFHFFDAVHPNKTIAKVWPCQCTTKWYKCAGENIYSRPRARCWRKSWLFLFYRAYILFLFFQWKQ